MWISILNTVKWPKITIVPAANSTRTQNRRTFSHWKNGMRSLCGAGMSNAKPVPFVVSNWWTHACTVRPNVKRILGSKTVSSLGATAIIRSIIAAFRCGWKRTIDAHCVNKSGTLSDWENEPLDYYTDLMVCLYITHLINQFCSVNNPRINPVSNRKSEYVNEQMLWRLYILFIN